MLELLDRQIGDRRVRVIATERDDGDVHPGRVAGAQLRERQVALTGRRWAMADQIHGAAVWVVDRGEGDPLGDAPPRADVVVAHDHDAAIGVWTADCASLLFVTDAHRLVGVHAGWRGLAAGVLDVAAEEARRDGHRIVATVGGPVIGPCCYEFGEAELRLVADGCGVDPAAVRATTTRGSTALDVSATVEAVLHRHGLAVDAAAPGCTGCDGRWWSHRVGVDTQRQALVGWWT